VSEPARLRERSSKTASGADARLKCDSGLDLDRVPWVVGMAELRGCGIACHHESLVVMGLEHAFVHVVAHDHLPGCFVINTTLSTLDPSRSVLEVADACRIGRLS